MSNAKKVRIEKSGDEGIEYSNIQEQWHSLHKTIKINSSTIMNNSMRPFRRKIL